MIASLRSAADSSSKCCCSVAFCLASGLLHLVAELARLVAELLGLIGVGALDLVGHALKARDGGFGAGASGDLRGRGLHQGRDAGLLGGEVLVSLALTGERADGVLTATEPDDLFCADASIWRSCSLKRVSWTLSWSGVPCVKVLWLKVLT